MATTNDMITGNISPWDVQDWSYLHELSVTITLEENNSCDDAAKITNS